MKKQIFLAPALGLALATSAFADNSNATQFDWTDIEYVQATGDAEKGERHFRACRACHSVEEGKNGVGPSLFGIVGSLSGQSEGFNYSDAMTSAGLTWDAETLDAFLTKPRDVVPGTTMQYRGERNEEKRADLIAYIAQFSE